MIIKNIMRKYLCRNCSRTERLNNEIIELTKEDKVIISNFIKTKKLLLIDFINSSNESIVYIEEHNYKYFFITMQLETISSGKLSGINFYGYIIEEFDHRPQKVTRLVTKPIYSIKYNNTINCIHIIDFISTPNKGYGSNVMKAFLKYVNILQVKKIVGTLSSVDEKDENNKLRRNHFYKKFGFKIEKDNHIRLDLTKKQ